MKKPALLARQRLLAVLAQMLSAAPASEFYRNTPADSAPEDLLTDIYLRLVV